MALTPEEKKQLESAVADFEKATTELGKAVKIGFLSTARQVTTSLRSWLDDIEKTLDKDPAPPEPKKDEKTS